MKPTRKSSRTGAALLVVTVLLQAIGCSTFQPLEQMDAVADAKPQQRHLRVTAADGIQYFFPRGQYNLECATGSFPSKVRGWGDKLGTYGLIEKGYFEVSLENGAKVEIETIDLTRSVLFGGVLASVAVLTFVGVKSFSSASDKGSESPTPPPAN